MPATTEVLEALAEQTEHYAALEFATHFHVYRDRQVLLERHDALDFDPPVYVSIEFDAEQV